MSKILNAAAFATGYVLGTRAGRDRYEQIVRTARRVREDAPDLASQAREQASHVRESASDAASGSGTGGAHAASSSDETGGGSGSGSDVAASTPMYSAPSPDAGPAPDDTPGVPAPGTSGQGEDEETPMYSAPSPDAGPAPEGSGSATSAGPRSTGTTPASPDDDHVEMQEEVAYSTGPDVETSIEDLTDEDPR